MKYYIQAQDVLRGPYPATELLDMLKYNEITGDTPARKDGDSDWSTVNSVLKLSTPPVFVDAGKSAIASEPDAKATCPPDSGPHASNIQDTQSQSPYWQIVSERTAYLGAVLLLVSAFLPAFGSGGKSLFVWSTVTFCVVIAAGLASFLALTRKMHAIIFFCGVVATANLTWLVAYSSTNSHFQQRSIVMEATKLADMADEGIRGAKELYDIAPWYTSAHENSAVLLESLGKIGALMQIQMALSRELGVVRWGIYFLFGGALCLLIGGLLGRPNDGANNAIFRASVYDVVRRSKTRAEQFSYSGTLALASLILAGFASVTKYIGLSYGLATLSLILAITTLYVAKYRLTIAVLGVSIALPFIGILYHAISSTVLR